MGVTKSGGVRVVDLSDSDAPRSFAASLHDTGFALLTGHEVPTSLIDQIIVEWEAFLSSGHAGDFAAADGSPWGYHRPPGGLTADGVTPRDLKDYFHLALGGSVPPGISRATIDMFATATDLAIRLLGWLEEISPDGPLSHLPVPLSRSVSVTRSVLRIQRYLPLDPAPPPGAIRALAHADINLLTLLPAPAVPGLQVLTRAGQWFDLAYDPGILIVNVGEMLDLASSGFYPATQHRVVIHRPADAMSPRWSMPMFFHPEDDAQLAPGITAADHRNTLLEGYRTKGWTVNTGTAANPANGPMARREGARS